MKNGCRGVWAFAALLSAVCQSVVHGATVYTVALLPGPVGSTSGTALSISNAGVIGYSQIGAHYQITLWQGAQPTQLPVPQGFDGWAGAISNSGDVVGSVGLPNSNQPQPALWHNGQLQMLSTLGLQQGVVYGINDQGVAVGEVDGGVDGSIYAVMWANGQPTILANSSIAVAASRLGQVLIVGQSGSSIWSNGTLTPITGPADTQFFAPRHLNDNGHVAGNFAFTQDASNQYGFFWENGVTTQLSNLPGDDFGFPDALNNSDQMVGSGDGGPDGLHALLWQDGQVFDLNSLIPSDSRWKLLEATDIADDGTIVGYGEFNGQTSAFELTPVVSATAAVPEAGTVGVMVLGGVLLMRRRRRGA